MSMKEFWEDDPDLFWAYRFSFYNKEKREEEMKNFNAWLQGAYFYEAVSVALANGFGKAHLNYSSKPYELDKKELSEEEQRDKTVAELKARVAQVQSIFENAGKQDVLIKGEKR